VNGIDIIFDTVSEFSFEISSKPLGRLVKLPRSPLRSGFAPPVVLLDKLVLGYRMTSTRLLRDAPFSIYWIDSL
jgi:hypothetical protein